MAAADPERGYDLIALLEVPDSLAYLLHYSHEFVPYYESVVERYTAPVEMEVGAAYGALRYPEYYVVLILYLGIGHCLDPYVSGAVIDCGFHRELSFFSYRIMNTAVYTMLIYRSMRSTTLNFGFPFFIFSNASFTLPSGYSSTILSGYLSRGNERTPPVNYK
jgi:hypothetical protein